MSESQSDMSLSNRFDNLSAPRYETMKVKTSTNRSVIASEDSIHSNNVIYDVIVAAEPQIIRPNLSNLTLPNAIDTPKKKTQSRQPRIDELLKVKPNTKSKSKPRKKASAKKGPKYKTFKLSKLQSSLEKQVVLMYSKGDIASTQRCRDMFPFDAKQNAEYTWNNEDHSFTVTLCIKIDPKHISEYDVMDTSASDNNHNSNHNSSMANHRNEVSHAPIIKKKRSSTSFMSVDWNDSRLQRQEKMETMRKEDRERRLNARASNQ
eukprot:216721_1